MEKVGGKFCRNLGEKCINYLLKIKHLLYWHSYMYSIWFNSNNVQVDLKSTPRSARGCLKRGSEKHGSEKRVTMQDTGSVCQSSRKYRRWSQFAPSCAVADFEEASVSAFHHVSQDAGVVGCWFHYAQAVMKRSNEIGVKESYGRDVDVATIVHCLLSLPFFPDSDIIDSEPRRRQLRLNRRRQMQQPQTTVVNL